MRDSNHDLIMGRCAPGLNEELPDVLNIRRDGERGFYYDDPITIDECKEYCHASAYCRFISYKPVPVFKEVSGQQKMTGWCYLHTKCPLEAIQRHSMNAKYRIWSKDNLTPRVCRPGYTDNTGPREGWDQACVFPFTFGSRTYTKCVKSQWTRRTWCATEVDADNGLLPNRWGYCECGSSDEDSLFNQLDGLVNWRRSLMEELDHRRRRLLNWWWS